MVLITARQSQHTQDPDVALTWGQVYRQVARWLDGQHPTPQLVEHFLGLLRAEGLGPPAPISHESILAYLPAQTLEPALKALVKRAKEEDWDWFYTQRPTSRSSNGPFLRWKKGDKFEDGRLGLDLLQGWRPGLFVGVMMDGTDHRVTPSKPNLGPDFCLILSLHVLARNPPTWNDLVSSEEFRALRERLAGYNGPWQVHDHLKEHRQPVRWHPLHIRRPLLEVMRGTVTVEDQVQRFMDASREVIDLVMAGGELNALWAWRPKP